MVSRSVVNRNGYYYLRETRSNGSGDREDEYISSFGKERPTIYKPKIIEGDSREVLKDGDRGSVGLVVTSPPYFLLKEAPWGGDYDEYIKEARRRDKAIVVPHDRDNESVQELAITIPLSCSKVRVTPIPLAPHKNIWRVGIPNWSVN